MILAIASGKGGTGKTTVALNLARTFAAPVQLLDCDVEEPNCHLFLRGEGAVSEIVSIPVPEVDAALCDACGECGRFCEYHAIAAFGSGPPVVFPEMCHGCGGCARVCPRGAIRERDRRIGIVETKQTGAITLVQGRLDVGAAMAPPLIRAVKARLRGDIPAILDAPPGTSCPVIAAIRGANLALLVTEPTPFGLHDLALAIATLRPMGRPLGVVVNRADADRRVQEYCQAENLPVLAELPDDRRVAETYARGELIFDRLPDWRDRFETLWVHIEEHL